MAITVSIASPLQKLTGGRGKVEADGKNIAEAIEALELRFPGIRAFLLDGRGRVLSHINIFLNDRDIQALQGIETPIQKGDQVVIIPAIAGGRGGEKGG